MPLPFFLPLKTILWYLTSIGSPWNKLFFWCIIRLYILYIDHDMAVLVRPDTIMRFPPLSNLKVNHNTCSLHLATHFQNQTSHMGMFYMVYWWQGWSLNVITWGEHNKILLSTWNENPNKHQNLFTQKVMTSQLLGHSSPPPPPLLLIRPCSFQCHLQGERAVTYPK